MAPHASLLTIQQKLILDQLRHTRGSPIPIERMVAALYGDRWDGGPDNPESIARTQLAKLRKWLEPHGIAILTIGWAANCQGYLIDPAHLDKLEELIAALPTMEIDLARR